MIRSFFFLFMLAFLPLLQTSMALSAPQATTLVTMAGNLNSSSNVLPGGVAAVPYASGVNTGATFEELQSTAQFSSTVSLVDSLGAVHAMQVYFYFVSPQTWVAQAVVDGGDVGLTSGYPLELGRSTISFSETGEPNAPWNIQFYTMWSNGAWAQDGEIFFQPFTSLPQPSLVSSLTQDGEPLIPATTKILGSANLDAASGLLSGGVNAIPDPAQSSLTEFRAAAELSTEIPVVSLKGVAHKLIVAFFHTSPNGWTLVVAVPTSSVSGASGGFVELGRVVLNFTASGALIYTEPLTANVSWIEGGVSSLEIIFSPITQYAAASYFSSFRVLPSTVGESAANMDFDGDKIDDLVVWRPQSGYWAVLSSLGGFSGGYYLWKQWGLPGDYPLAGDYDGDGLADLAVWRPGDGVWYICPSRKQFDCAQALTPQFGLPGDRPVRGDFDGDGRLDLAVWRKSSGKFYFYSSRDAYVLEREWGLREDIPLTTGISK